MFGYFSGAPEAMTETSTSIVSSWKSAERTSRHWTMYFASSAGVLGWRTFLKPVEWKEMGKLHSAAASHITCHSGW